MEVLLNVIWMEALVNLCLRPLSCYLEIYHIAISHAILLSLLLLGVPGFAVRPPLTLLWCWCPCALSDQPHYFTQEPFHSGWWLISLLSMWLILQKFQLILYFLHIFSCEWHGTHMQALWIPNYWAWQHSYYLCMIDCLLDRLTDWLGTYYLDVIPRYYPCLLPPLWRF